MKTFRNSSNAVSNVLVGSFLAVGLFAQTRTEDITLPVDDGSILIRAQFIRVNELGSYIPELALKLKNQTSSSWRTLELQFDIGGLCNGEPRQWTVPVATSLGWAEDHSVGKDYTNYVIPLVGKVDGCKTEIIRASLILAESQNTRIEGVRGERIDLQRQLQDIEQKHEAEAAAQAEEKRKADRAAEAQAEVQAKKDAAEAARRKARTAEERRRIRAACSTIYQSTIDKKVQDLTVREEQQVRACRALDMYSPQ
jgi:hypothetical protein